MKHTVFNITVILFLFSAAVQAQSPGGVAGPVKWATGKDNGTVQLSGTGGMTFVGVGRIQQGSEQLLWNVSTRSGKTGRVQTTARSANLARGTFMNYTDVTRYRSCACIPTAALLPTERRERSVSVK